MQPRFILPAVLLLTAAPGLAGQAVAPAPDVLSPARTGGLEAVDLALAKLSTHRRLMLVGAHPDDEDNALLTWVGRGLAGEAAYLSLSRGEGGQNLIGTELGVELGIIRTGELEAARRIEGTRQYFARAYDFGYTRSLEETFTRWPRDVLLEDTMRAMRRFRPQVVVSVFPGDERGGHGQHQAAGRIAREAFALAREGREFPSLDAEGLAPWAPAALYQRAWSPESATARFELDALDPITGRSLAQIAAASRSQHRSQDMGREQRLGRWIGGVAWEAGAGKGGNDVFAGIDTRLEAIADLVEDGEARAVIAESLARVAELARATRRSLSPARLADAVGPLSEMVRELDLALGRVPRDAESTDAVSVLLGEKKDVATRALIVAAGVMVDAVAERERLVAGGKVAVTVELWAAGGVEVEVQEVYLSGSLYGDELLPPDASDHSERTGVTSWRFSAPIPRVAEPTMPYYLRRPRRGDLYDWSGAPAAEWGEPRAPAPLLVGLELSIAGARVAFAREVVHRYGDQAVGEVRRPLRVVPALEVEIERGPVLWNRVVAKALSVAAVVRSNVDGEIEDGLELKLPEGWETGDPASASGFALSGGRHEQAVTLAVEVPAGVAGGRYELAIRTTGEAGRPSWHRRETRDELTLPVLEYPHVRPTPSPREAKVQLSVFDLELPAVEKVGYVVGASDRVPAVLTTLGLPLEILTAEDLARGDLSPFDVIVVGSRAYEVDAALAGANDRLLDFARAGGTLIVQYQQYQFVRGEYAPFPLTIARPHGRVTDETAPIEVLAPDHPVFSTPNRIGAADWLDWVQERGLYFAQSWDEAFQPLLSLADSGREAERGAMLVAPLGDGVYVYTGLSFFRQLPAGVPGAIRLFANLLALGSDE